MTDNDVRQAFTTLLSAYQNIDDLKAKIEVLERRLAEQTESDLENELVANQHIRDVSFLGKQLQSSEQENKLLRDLLQRASYHLIPFENHRLISEIHAVLRQ